MTLVAGLDATAVGDHEVGKILALAVLEVARVPADAHPHLAQTPLTAGEVAAVVAGRRKQRLVVFDGSGICLLKW